MAQKFLYDPVQLAFRQLSQLAEFRELMGAADAAAALERCIFLQTEWDQAAETEVALIPGCIGGLQDGLSRRRGNATQFKTAGIQIWLMLQAEVPADFAAEVVADYPTDFADKDPQPQDWFVLKCQELWDALEADVIAAGTGVLDISEIQCQIYPRMSRQDEEPTTLTGGALVGQRDYWWTVWLLTVRG